MRRARKSITLFDDFQDLRGQFHSKRAIEVAMAEGRNMFRVWPQASRGFRKKLASADDSRDVSPRWM